MPLVRPVTVIGDEAPMAVMPTKKHRLFPGGARWITGLKTRDKSLRWHGRDRFEDAAGDLVRIALAVWKLRAF